MKYIDCFSTLGCHDRSLDEILELCRKFGINKLEIRGIGGVMSNSEIEEFKNDNLTGTLDRFRSAGVQPYILGTSCAFDDDKKAQEAIAEGRDALRIASELGAFGIRVFGNKIKDEYDVSKKRLCSGLSELCREAAGVNVLLEVHGNYNTVETLLPVCETLSAFPNFGLIWDIEHTHADYGENWPVFYDALRPYIRHVHVKDSKDGALCLPFSGDLPIRAILARLRADGYCGSVSLEWERRWHPALGPIEPALSLL